MQHILVSACLLGEAVRYNGTDRRSDDPILKRWLAEGRVVPVCPEIAAGAPVPRPPSEIAGNGGGAGVLAGTARVIEPDGHDVTDLFLAGAELTLALARAQGIRMAVLKESSPSCGSLTIHDGRFAGRRVNGEGVAAARLRQDGIAVFSEEQFAEADALLEQLDAPIKSI